MSPRTSSRLARHEQQKLLKQTVIMGGAAVILGLGFIFFVLPRSIQLITTLTGGDQVILEDTQLPPQVPVLSAPPSATTSAIVAITGFAQIESDVVLVVNSEQQDRQRATSEGTFAFEAQLREGENTIGAYAIGKDQQESNLSSTLTVMKDTQPPRLDIAEPQEGQAIELRANQTISIKGNTDPQTQISVNGRLLFAQSDGSFSSSYLLQEGQNTLDFIATDPAGNQTTKTIKVSFRF